MINIIFSLYAESREIWGDTYHKSRRMTIWRNQWNKNVMEESQIVYVFSHMENLDLNICIYNVKAAEGLFESK